MSGATAFEAHGMSALDTLPPDTRFECGVCWRVYDPAEGDDYWQIPAGTAFAALPDHWTCPNCDTPREKFIALTDSKTLPQQRLAQLEAAYTALANGSMKDLPVNNTRLQVELIGFRPFGEDWLGIVVAPWFMNITILPGNPDLLTHRPNGEKSTRTLPAGEFEFVLGRVDPIGPVLTCSLFSPMDEFGSHSAAQETAVAALAALFNKNIDHLDAEPAHKPPPSAQDRRSLIFGRRNASPEPDRDA